MIREPISKLFDQIYNAEVNNLSGKPLFNTLMDSGLAGKCGVPFHVSLLLSGNRGLLDAIKEWRGIILGRGNSNAKGHQGCHGMGRGQQRGRGSGEEVR